MRTAITLVALAALAAPAHAEITKLGGFQLGQKLKKLNMKKTSILGCKGTLEVHVDHKKVSELRFEVSTGCSIAPDTVTAQMGVQPIANKTGDQLWEGQKASIILTSEVGGEGKIDIVLLVPPGAGSKRSCWPDDGFATFYAGFQKAVAAGKYDGFDDPSSDGEAWPDILGDNAKAVVSGELAPTCDPEYGWWSLALDSGTLTAQRGTGDAWSWTALEANEGD